MKWFRSSGKTEDYEKEYLTRYNEQQEPEQKKNTSKDKKSIKKEPEALSTKLEFVKQEYSVTIGNLMNAKKELKNVKEIIQELNNEHASIVSRTNLLEKSYLK